METGSVYFSALSISFVHFRYILATVPFKTMNLLIYFAVMLIIEKGNGLNLRSSVILDDRGYANIAVAIDDSIPENMDLITAIQDMFRDGSRFLYQATRRRVFFKNVTILIPSHWTKRSEYGSPGRLTFDTADVIVAEPNPIWAPEPYTQQVLGCGQPGSFIHFSQNFLLDDEVTGIYGELGRILVHEWGHYRWGLFNEYPDEVGDADHVVHFYQSMMDLRWKPVTCSQEYKWSPTRIVQRGNAILYGMCDGNPADGYQNGCIVRTTSAGQATGSIMHGPLTYPQIVNFCDDDPSDTGNLHNSEAPNKHNRLCNARSAWEVMRGHEDFTADNYSSPPDLSDAQLEPSFHLVQAGSRDACRVVLVLDTSGSMGSANRIDKVNSAATAFVNLVDDGLWLGVVTFTNSPTTEKELTQIRTPAERDSLRGIFNLTASGGTCIGCGLERGLEVLMGHPSGTADGGLILLMTDGRDSRIDNHPIRQTLRNNGVRVNTVAIGEDTYGELNLIAQETGGAAIFYPDNGTSSIISALTQTVEMCTTTNSIGIQLVGEGFLLGNGSIQAGRLNFDNSIGNRTQFIVTYTSSSSSTAPGVNVVITQPDNTTITERNQQYTVHTNRNVITIAVEGLAMSGEWSYSIENTFSGLQSVTFSVFSRINMEGDDEPIVMKSGVGNSVLDLSVGVKPLSAFVKLSKGFQPVVKAIVRAIVEKPGGYVADLIELRDDGGGADITANDGIYSRFITNITGKGFYGIRAISENDGSAIILTRARTGLSRVQAALRVADDGTIISPGTIGSYEVRFPGVESSQTLQGVPAPAFTRSSSVGSTTITNLPDGFTPGQDLFPPARVQDLRVTVTFVGNSSLVLTWIAPGDDLDTGAATYYDIRVGNSSSQLLGNFSNATEVSQSSILAGNLSSPKPSGSVETFIITVPDMTELNSFSYSFALRAIDDDGKSSPISNVAIATFRRVIPSPPSTPPGPCNGTACINGGELEESTCTCSCTDDFQGNLCQYNKTQLRNGVQIHLRANISQCGQLLDSLLTASSDQLNDYCLNEFESCCPGEAIANRPQGNYVSDGGMMIADGYPISADQSDDCYVVLFAIRPNEPELCGSNRRRKRSKMEIRVKRQLPEQSVFVAQSLLLGALSSGESAIEIAIGTDIYSITLPHVEGDRRSTVPAFVIGAAVAAAIIFILLILCLFVCCARVSIRNEFLKERYYNQDRKSKQGPRFVGEDPTGRNISTISGRPHLRINPVNSRRKPDGSQLESYGMESYPMSIYHRPYEM
ncbi:calcium-activated chloride channel regulator 1-like [Lytechinus variegatus]|uniref:calcium-activated chloride channel regulator 1-like n=1 Tax=Lytechinus variegatus TaxID=7654 RepID=UPI001BB17B45|nr:calcium-activated chloride channel regulator 1-like [Lytechinus variegatus]